MHYVDATQLQSPCRHLSLKIVVGWGGSGMDSRRSCITQRNYCKRGRCLGRRAMPLQQQSPCLRLSGMAVGW